MTNPVTPPSQPYHGGAVPPPYGPGGPPQYGQGAPPQYGQGGSPQYGQGGSPQYGQGGSPQYGQGAPVPYGQGGPVPPQYGPAGAVPPPYSDGGTVLPTYGAPGTKKGGVAKKIGSVAAVLVVLVVGGLAKGFASSYFKSDPTAKAKVGDCISTDSAVKGDQEQDAQAKIATCGTPAAAFSIVGRVEKEKDTASKSCDKFFTEEKAAYAVYASKDGDGYLLCLKKV